MGSTVPRSAYPSVYVMSKDPVPLPVEPAGTEILGLRKWKEACPNNPINSPRPNPSIHAVGRLPRRMS